MTNNTRNINNIFYIFVLAHLIFWTLVPSLTNQNLPLDTIEALAWGSNLDWGFNKHPPMSAFFPEVFFQIFGSQDWAYYLLSQIFVIISFYYVFKFSKEFFNNDLLGLISVLLIEAIYFYNFTTPEFNVNVAQLPFWALTVYYCWQSLENNKIKNWALLGFFAGLGFLSKYLFIYLLLGIDIFFIYYFLINKKIHFKKTFFIPGIVFILVILPHLIWLSQNNFVTIFYGLNRTGLEEFNFFEHIKNPIIFLSKQAGVLIPLFFMFFLIVSKLKTTINFKDKKVFFLLSITVIPFLLMFLTSFLTGAKIRTMWMTPFYLFLGTLLIYIFQKKVNFKKLNHFIYLFLILFILSPSTYLYISLTEKIKRTDYPGKEIARLVQNRWDENFSNEIKIVVGDEWSGGNLSYHLASRPKWYNSLNKDLKNIKIDGGVIYIGNPKVLKKICPGVYGKINPNGICMIGAR